MSEKLYSANCPIHGMIGCDICNRVLVVFADKKQRSKRRRNRDKKEIKTQIKEIDNDTSAI